MFVDAAAVAVKSKIAFAGPAISAFQRRVRGEEAILRDHICKEMNALNFERCCCIPKNQPGADWRVLQEIVDRDPSRAKFQVWPWLLFMTTLPNQMLDQMCTSGVQTNSSTGGSEEGNHVRGVPSYYLQFLTYRQLAELHLTFDFRVSLRRSWRGCNRLRHW